MKFGDYLSDKAMSLCFAAAALLFLCFGAVVAGLTLWKGLICAAAGAAFLAAWIAVGYRMEAAKAARFRRVTRDLPDKYLLGEVLAEPRGALAKEYYGVVKTVSSSAISQTEKALRDKREYCEYVESWIHELKTPLTACELMIDNGADAKALRPQLKKAENLTENILYYARLGTAFHDRRIGAVQAETLAAEAVRNLKEILIAAGLTVEISGSCALRTDDKAVRFVLGQLLSNCAKYCPGCKIEILIGEGSITVRDNGKGVAAHELPALTRRGFTGGKHEGTGMGLYIVAQLCEELGIGLRFDSVYGRFFAVTLDFNLTKA